MKLILFRGRPGTGKTTLTHAFAEKTNFPILRKDDMHDSVAKYIPEHSDRSRASFAVLYKILESNLHSNITFILDFSFQSSEDFSIIKNWCAERGAELRSILVTCSDEKVWAERFNKRALNPTPNQTITDFEELRKHYGTMQLSPEAGEIVIDTIMPVDEILGDIIKI